MSLQVPGTLSLEINSASLHQRLERLLSSRALCYSPDLGKGKAAAQVPGGRDEELPRQGRTRIQGESCEAARSGQLCYGFKRE